MSNASGIEKTCPACGASFYVQAYRIEQAKFCSMKCLWAGRPKRVRRKIDCICRQCLKPYQVDPSRKNKTGFCSIRCSTTFNAPKRAIAQVRAAAALPGHKICSACNEQKLIAEYWKHVNGFDGLRSKCIACSKKMQEQWGERNPEKKAEADRHYYAENATQLSEASKAKYAADPAAFSKRNKAWRAANPDKVTKANRKKRDQAGDAVMGGHGEDRSVLC